MLGARGAGAVQTLQLPAKWELLVLSFRSVVTGFNPVFLQLKCQVGTARERNQLGPRGSSGTCPEEQPRALCCSCLFPLLSGRRSSAPLFLPALLRGRVSPPNSQSSAVLCVCADPRRAPALRAAASARLAGLAITHCSWKRLLRDSQVSRLMCRGFCLEFLGAFSLGLHLTGKVERVQRAPPSPSQWQTGPAPSPFPAGRRSTWR